MRIDAHVHIFPDKICPQTIEGLAHANTDMALDYYGDGSLANAKENMIKWGIDLGILVPIATNGKQQRAVNDFAAHIQGTENHLIAFGSVYPWAPDWREELERVAELGLYGIKLHPDYQGFYMDDPKVYPLYEAISALGLPVLFHTGSDPISPGDIHACPRAVKKVAMDFPKLTIIAAHVGGLTFMREVPIDYYGHLPNLYFDTAIASRAIEPSKMRRIIDYYGSDRFIFGTDNPWSSGTYDFDYFKKVGLSKEEESLIFHRNMERILNARERIHEENEK